MYSAAVKERNLAPTLYSADALPSDPWRDFPVSEIAHHGDHCCDVAREWLIAMDFAQLNGGSLRSGPRWLRKTYEWGPSAWPITWCEVVHRKVIDCGAHAALAHEVFAARGGTALRAQFVQRYSDDATEQWRRKWSDEQVSDHWLGENAIYHEGNALLGEGDELKLWDGSSGCWLNPRQEGGYGAVLAVRVFDTHAPEDRVFSWGDHRVRPNQWCQIPS
jgi:hypothetical protein